MLVIKNWAKGPYFLCKEDQTVERVDGPVPKKWLPGDIVQGDELQRKPTDHQSIVGIIDYTNRTGQGFTSRNIPLYMFHPFKRSYPPMLVASKAKPSQNQIATVNYEHWDNKWPRAGIQKRLGPVGDRDTEVAAYILNTSVGKPPTTLPQPNLTNHESYDATVFHIDPEGCEDVDDVLSFRPIEGGYEFGIGIAHVAAWVAEHSDLDLYARRLGETVYVDGKPVVPMLPPSLSANAASLRSDGIERPVLSRVYTIQDDHVTNVRWARQMLRVQTTYTYESIQTDAATCKKITDTLRILHGTVSNDPHEWIERLMVLYNEAAAMTLKEHGQGILRTQMEGLSETDWQTIAKRSGHDELAFFGYGAGSYVPATSEETGHKGLGLHVYTHASSPLRRYVDLVNQRHLTHILFETQMPTWAPNCLLLNERRRIGKQLDRDLCFVRNLQADRITETDAIVLKKGKESWKLYVPAWKRTVRAKTEEPKEFEQGETVTLRAYTNTKAVSDNRVVCRFS